MDVLAACPENRYPELGSAYGAPIPPLKGILTQLNLSNKKGRHKCLPFESIEYCLEVGLGPSSSVLDLDWFLLELLSDSSRFTGQITQVV